MAEGFFHDAHEVYYRLKESDPWTWTATFATKRQADGYVAIMRNVGTKSEFEVRAV
jgi:hypothetical protein